MARLHPYEYVFFNHIIGGVRGAQTRFMLDYWGLAFKEAGAKLRETLKARGDCRARPQMEGRGVRPASARRASRSASSSSRPGSRKARTSR